MLVSISKACDVLGVCAKTLRRWERRGFIIPYRTPGNHRRYDYDALVEFRESCVYEPRVETRTGVAAVYARVSSQKQTEDLARQVDFLADRARKDGFEVKIYSDIGSGWQVVAPSYCACPRHLSDIPCGYSLDLRSLKKLETQIVPCFYRPSGMLAGRDGPSPRTD